MISKMFLRDFHSKVITNIKWHTNILLLLASPEKVVYAFLLDMLYQISASSFPADKYFLIISFIHIYNLVSVLSFSKWNWYKMSYIYLNLEEANIVFVYACVIQMYYGCGRISLTLGELLLKTDLTDSQQTVRVCNLPRDKVLKKCKILWI